MSISSQTLFFSSRFYQKIRRTLCIDDAFLHRSFPFSLVDSFCTLLVLVSLLGNLLIGCSPVSQTCSDSQLRENNQRCEEVCSPHSFSSSTSCHSPDQVSAHHPECLAIHGALCIRSLEWQDHHPRSSVLTPGESMEIHSFTLYNAGQEALQVEGINLSSETQGLVFEEGSLSILDPSGSPILETSHAHSSPSILSSQCESGLIAAQSQCQFDLGVQVQIQNHAPVNQTQSLSLAIKSGDHQNFQFSLPLLIVDPNQGLVLDQIFFEDESRDQKLQAADHVRLNRLQFYNQSLAHFDHLSAHISPHPDDLHLVEMLDPTQMWDDQQKAIEGFESLNEITCKGALLNQNQETIPNQDRICHLDFEGLFKIHPDAEIGQHIRFEVRFKEGQESLEDLLSFEFEVQDPYTELENAELILGEDLNQDHLISPGEQVRLNGFKVQHLDGPALRLKGRVSTNSPWVLLRENSNLSIQVNTLDVLSAPCGQPNTDQESTCFAPLNIRFDLDEETPIGEEITFQIELSDQFTQRYQFEWSFIVNQPSISLDLVEVEIHQDTFDAALSAGESGMISYIKFKNTGLADALGVHVQVQSDSPWIEIDGDQEWEIAMTNASDEHNDEHACLSTLYQEDTYCYSRSNLSFKVIDDAPLGAEILFLFHVQSELGFQQTFPYTFALDSF